MRVSGANLTRMRRFSEQEAVSRREAENWSDARRRRCAETPATIESELGQPFFEWLAAQERAPTGAR